VKSFLGWHGRWQPPVYERVETKSALASDLDGAIAAWQKVRSGGAMRLEWADEQNRLRAHVRRPGGSMELITQVLQDAGGGEDPHGTVSWRAARARLELNGRNTNGVALVERLATPKTSWPRFGRFEMWLYSPGEGGLLLARVPLENPTRGTAVEIQPSKGEQGVRARVRQFRVEPVASRSDAKSGYQLPERWRLKLRGTKLVDRIDGSLARGEAPSGKPAVYDISLATQPGGAGAAMVFHLQDRP